MPASSPMHLLHRYAIAAALVAAAFLVRLMLLPVVGGATPYATFYMAVVGTAVLAGLGPGILAALVGGFLGRYFFVEPMGSMNIGDVGEAIGFSFYFLVSGTVLAALEARKRAAALARQRLAAVEEQVFMREAAEAARDAERRWAVQTLASIGDGVITTDAKGRVTFLNAIASKLTGWTLADAVGQPIETVFNILNEQTRERVASPVDKVLREGVIIGLANHTALIRRDGSEVAIDDSGAPIRDEAGRIVGTVLVFRDFETRRRAEEAAGRLAAIVESSRDAIISKSPDGVIRTWNAGAERLFGYTPAEAIGKHISLLVPPGKLQEEASLAENVRGGRNVQSLETVRRRKDGTDVPVSITASPICNSYAELIGISLIARDITAQQELQAQLLQSQKLESLGVLAGGVAHDFNNLLTGVVGGGSLALELADGNPALRSILEQVVIAGQRAADLTRQLLAYSGRGKFVVERVDAAEVVAEMVELLRSSIPRTVNLRLEPVSEPMLIEVDVAQFRQVMMNLITNGAEATEGRSGTVTVTMGRRWLDEPQLSGLRRDGEVRPGEYVCVEVRDNGSGMTPAVVNRIFDPFFTTKFMGRGLGLSAVLGIVRGHNGGIRIDSIPGEGSTFTVFFPAAHVEPAPVAESGERTPVVLVADDEAIVRETARLGLERRGYRVLLASNGQEAVECFQQHRSAVCMVVLDLTMPVLSGRDALRMLKGLRADVPIVICSGFNEEQAMEQCRGWDVAGFLKKPFTIDELERKVKAAGVAAAGA